MVTEENGAQVTFVPNGSLWAPQSPYLIATLTHNGDGTWTYVRRATDTLKFNSTGQLVSITNLNGYVTNYTYTVINTHSDLTTMTDASSGRTLTLAWNAAGTLITSVTHANVTPNRVVSFSTTTATGTSPTLSM